MPVNKETVGIAHEGLRREEGVFFLFSEKIIGSVSL